MCVPVVIHATCLAPRVRKRALFVRQWRPGALRAKLQVWEGRVSLTSSCQISLSAVSIDFDAQNLRRIAFCMYKLASYAFPPLFSILRMSPCSWAQPYTVFPCLNPA